MHQRPDFAGNGLHGCACGCLAGKKETAGAYTPKAISKSEYAAINLPEVLA
ncbi:MAG: hypothetical protein OFPI_20970 [Osedax symbiont Rs2]|nr:MAG: hypothetical protein OFPI_20970 [Osedax symbiont Rs2]